jgi:hypothetical protein
MTKVLPKSKPKNRELAQQKENLSKAATVVAKTLNLAPAAIKSAFSGNADALIKAMKSLDDEKPKMMKGGAMVAKKKMRGGGMAKMAAKKMRGGGVAAKKMRGGGMAKMASKKMMRGGMAKKK